MSGQMILFGMIPYIRTFGFAPETRKSIFTVPIKRTDIKLNEMPSLAIENIGRKANCRATIFAAVTLGGREPPDYES